MTTIATILVSLALISLSVCETPCTSPTSFEAAIVEWNPSGKFQFALEGNAAYDLSKSAIYIKALSKVQPFPAVEVEVLELWDSATPEALGKQYTILPSGNCTVGPTLNPFIPIQIPPSATFVSSFNIGSQGVNAWRGILPSLGPYFFTFTDAPDCYPVQFALNNGTGHPLGFVDTMFYNVSPGVKNPEVFVPPPNCVPL